jgi:rare lipoprotein A (peptidoglycan hydrolase)
MQTDVGGFFIHDGTAEVRVKRIEKEPDNSKKKKKKRTKKHEKVRENDDVAEIESDVVSNSHQASKNDHSPSKIEKASTFEFSPALKVVFDHLESKAKSSNSIFFYSNFLKKNLI